MAKYSKIQQKRAQAAALGFIAASPKGEKSKSKMRSYMNWAIKERLIISLDAGGQEEITKSLEMNFNDCIMILKNLRKAQKRKIVRLMAKWITESGDVVDDEVELLFDICVLSGLPMPESWNYPSLSKKLDALRDNKSYKTISSWNKDALEIIID